MLGADAMMSADQPRLDVAEDGMDDGEEFGGIGCSVQDHRGVFEVIAESGVASLIGFKTIRQQMRLGRDIGLEESAEFHGIGGRQHGDPGIPGEKAVLALHGMAVLTLLVPGRRRLLNGGDNHALIRICGAAARTCGVTPAADESLVGFQEAAQRRGRILAQSMLQFVRHGPGRLVGNAQFPLEELRRNASFVTAHQIGGKKPFRQSRPCPVKDGPGGH